MTMFGDTLRAMQSNTEHGPPYNGAVVADLTVHDIAITGVADSGFIGHFENPVGGSVPSNRDPKSSMAVLTEIEAHQADDYTRPNNILWCSAMTKTPSDGAFKLRRLMSRIGRHQAAIL